MGESVSGCHQPGADCIGGAAVPRAASSRYPYFLPHMGQANPLRPPLRVIRNKTIKTLTFVFNGLTADFATLGCFGLRSHPIQDFPPRRRRQRDQRTSSTSLANRASAIGCRAHNAPLQPPLRRIWLIMARRVASSRGQRRRGRKRGRASLTATRCVARLFPGCAERPRGAVTATRGRAYRSRSRARASRLSMARLAVERNLRW